MKKYLLLLLFTFTLLVPKVGDSQVLISLLFGDKLNSEKIEFGLIGGDNISFLLTQPESHGMGNFNLGFYFHFKLTQRSFLSTGVLVKSNVGATGMETYPLGDAEFDSVYAGGTLTKKLHYFYVPIMYQYRFNNNRWYLEGGFQVGLRGKANDIFDQEALGGDLTFTTSIKNEIRHLDAGLLGGAGYKFKKEVKSIALGVNYYYGLVNVSLVEGEKIMNSSIYIYVKIPIGANAKKKKKEKEKKKKK